VVDRGKAFLPATWACTELAPVRTRPWRINIEGQAYENFAAQQRFLFSVRQFCHFSALAHFVKILT